MHTHSPHRCSLLWIALVLSVAAGCSREDDITQTEEGQLVLGRVAEREVVERGIEPGSRTLVFRSFNGTLELQGTEETIARLTFEKTARASYRDRALELLEQIRITESGGDAEYRFVMHPAEPERLNVDVRGTIPSGTPVRIEMLSGTVRLSGVTGRIRVELTSGRVSIDRAGGYVDVALRNGDIEAGLQALPADGVVRLETRNGDVALALPPSASARIDAQTQAGVIRTEGALTFTRRNLGLRGAGAEFDARVGRGEARITLGTRNGSITLRENQPAVPPPAFETPAPDSSRVRAPFDSTSAPTDSI